MFLRQYQYKPCLTLLVIAMGSIGCSQSLDSGPSVRVVSLAEFSKSVQIDQSEATASESDTSAYVEPKILEPAHTTASTQDEQNTKPSTKSIDPQPREFFQERSALRLDKPGDRIVVDSFVGQVNGRPIYADDFLSSLEDRLVEVAAKTTGQTRIREFEQIISSRLVRVVKNELILADAESTLSEQEQLGLFAFLKSRQDELIRQTSPDGRYAAEAEVRRDTGVESLQDLFDFQRDQILIAQLRRQKIAPRVIVSWRDIEQEYQRRYKEFNPPARVTLSKIQFKNETQADKIEQVIKRLEAGDEFTDIARDLKVPKDGVWDTLKMGEGGITDIDVADRFKKKLKGLGQGDTTDPIVSENSTLWFHVKEVTRPEGRSLYDNSVQQELANSLHELRTNEEMEKYIRSLFEDGIFDELEDMGRRLVSIALQRYAK